MSGRSRLWRTSVGSVVLAIGVQLVGFVWLAGASLGGGAYAALGLGAALAVGLGVWLGGRAEARISRLSRRLLVVADASPGASPLPVASDAPWADRHSRNPLERAVADLQHRVATSLEDTRRRREQVQDAGVYKTAFLKAVSHELRTPLNAILGFTDILLAGIEGELSDSRRENLQVIRESGERLLEIFNDSIELSAMASGQLSLRRERVDVGELLDEVVAQLEPRRGARPVHLHAQLPDAPVVLSVQRDRLLRVLQTLGEYALSRTEAGAVAFVVHTRDADASADAPGWLVLAVHDGGPALDADALEGLMRPDRARDVNGRRMALRLAIAKQLTELHGGQLKTCPGEAGRSFSLELPLASARASRPSGAIAEGTND